VLGWFGDQDPTVQAALIAGVVSLAVNILATPLRYLLDKRLLKHRLRAEYEQEQRKALRQLIGRYVARMVEAGEALDHRMENLYSNPASESYLAVGATTPSPTITLIALSTACCPSQRSLSDSRMKQFSWIRELPSKAT
jgi:hypothetical protein